MKPLRQIKNQRGVGLIEVLISLAILGLVAVAFLAGLATASKAVLIADVRTTAESVARTQMEYVKSQGYQKAEPGGVGIYLKLDDIPEGFTIYSLDRDGDPVEDIVGVPWFFPLEGTFEELKGWPVEIDDGLQMIKLVIKQGDKEVLRLANVKVNR